jgi:hypothetical protein
MPIWRNRPSIPKVRASSGTIGTMFLPMFLSFSSTVRMRTKAMVVEISRSPVPSSTALERLQRRNRQRRRRSLRRLGRKPPNTVAPLAQITCASSESSSGFRTAACAMSSSATGMLKRSRKARRSVDSDLLLLVGDHLAFAGLAQAEALDSVRENDRGLTLVVVIAAA